MNVAAGPAPSQLACVPNSPKELPRLWRLKSTALSATMEPLGKRNQYTDLVYSESPHSACQTHRGEWRNRGSGLGQESPVWQQGASLSCCQEGFRLQGTVLHPFLLHQDLYTNAVALPHPPHTHPHLPPPTRFLSSPSFLLKRQFSAFLSLFPTPFHFPNKTYHSSSVSIAILPPAVPARNITIPTCKR